MEKPTLRRVLADSHVAVVIIAVLLFAALDNGFSAMWELASSIAVFVFTAIAIQDIPAHEFSILDSLRLIALTAYVYYALSAACAAWLLSLWAYGVGPIDCLSEYHRRIFGRQGA